MNGMAPMVHSNLYEYDRSLAETEHISLLCGLDEAGRGPLCGPVAIGAAILDSAADAIEGINDSKKLSEKRREELYPIVAERCLAYQVVLVSPADIDRLNILQAVFWGMQQAVEKLSVKPQLILVDGNKSPSFEGVASRAVTKGDAKSACIAAASILAKVTRDRYMAELGRQYPQYKLEKHKGYPTKLHYQLLAQYGLQDFYRQSFLKNWRRSM